MNISLNTVGGYSPVTTGRQEIAAGGSSAPSAVAVATPAPAVTLPALPGSGGREFVVDNPATRQRLDHMFQEFMTAHDQGAEFSVDQATGMTIVRIVNRASGEVVRQIPTEEVVRIAQYFDSQSCCVDAEA